MNPLAIAGVNATKHAIMRFISVVCVALVIAGLYYAVYRTFIKPRPSESYQQKAQQIINNETNFFPNKKVFGIGLTLWGWDIGIVKLDYPEEKEITKEVRK